VDIVYRNKNHNKYIVESYFFKYVVEG